MMIYMTHPVHGAMHVYSEAEAVANEKNGWVRDGSVPVAPQVNPDLAKLYEEKSGSAPEEGMTESEMLAEIKGEVEDPANDLDVLRSAWEVKFSKPVDKRKGIAKLRQELEE